ncbi:penicillin-binding protein 1A [Hydrogenovibrio thermophilus]|uniref:Penicillin-binding protein 1A n=1 Tax=Hydrogenovibrio thermophilus TaxID=265883 RepID=A0A410H5M8_9GAMM|nr:penicillin-binding protein 1A [Hydrogenovibrio thermophilus]QAB16225.1 penicillin-binding protein 1A [Hydrogenovibrio thermophilus]
MNDETQNSTPEQGAEQAPKPKKKRGFFKRFFWISTFLGAIVAPLVVVILYAVTIYPTLPDASALKDVTYQVPLKIVTRDGQLISEIGTKKRIPLDYSEIPERMTQAIISSEDENFFEHGGVDFKGLARAAYELITTGSKQSGGSTITMQVARNFFLSKKKTYLRKLNEIVLSYKIEHQISKQEILAIYLNKIFLGYRSYGVAAAAQTYYGKPIDQLSLDEYAMIAGLPKAPSRYNPIYNPERAKLRRNYVLRRMYENHYITEEQMKEAQAVPVHAKLTGARIDIEAGYVAEMARSFAIDNFGEDALKNGLTITTTIDSQLQSTANLSVRNGLQDYERRHGYRGPIKHVAPTLLTNKEQLLEALDPIEKFGYLETGVVLRVTEKTADVLVSNGEETQLQLDNMLWAAPYIDVNKTGSEPQSVAEVLKRGDVIYLQKLDDQWRLAQDPKTEAALVSVDPSNGRIISLVGGFDYFRSKFNRVTQAVRQVGSNIKPFLYSAGLNKGMTAATIINDAPVVFHDRALEDTWRPENYSGRFYGPTRLRMALAHSRNLVSIRLLQQIGIRYAVDYLERFGFPQDQLNAHRDLSLALGSVQLTPLQVVRGYATFANTGYLIEPYLIDSVQDFSGQTIYQAQPQRACNAQCVEGDPQNAPRVVTPQNAYIMTSMMQDVINHGSGRKAKVLERNDIAGKTGTTNDQKDAWFSGFNPDIATTVWVGFDTPTTLGRSEVGGRAALPIWIDYMREALKPYPNAPFGLPEGLVNVPIDRSTGLAVPADTPGAFFEIFREQNAPEIPDISETKMEQITQELFD